MNRQRLAWVRGLALAAVVCFAGLTSYVLVRLVDLHGELAEDIGENVVWAMSQTMFQSAVAAQTSLLAEQAEQAEGQRMRLAMQHQVLKARLGILTGAALGGFMQRAGLEADIAQAQRMIDEPRPDYAALHLLMRDVGNQVMLAEREEAGTRRDDHSRLMWQLMFGLVGVLASGAVLCWQLLRSLGRAENANAEIVRQHVQARQLLDALELERSVRQRYRDFVSLMSHQLRTPLAVIDSSAQRLVRQDQALPGGQSIEDRALRIRRSVEQLNQLIARVLEGLRLDDQQPHGALALELAACDWREIMAEVLENLGDTLGDRQVLLNWPEGADIGLLCDPMWCAEILGNLLSNAHKYSPPGLPIEVDSRTVDGWLHCCVRDHGEGVDRQDMERIFERFYRGHWGSLAPGIGLGLPIARTLAGWHGGSVDVHNAGSGGAVFVLRLPLAGPSAFGTGAAVDG